VAERFAPRIFRITYRSAINNKLVRVFAKAPYSGSFALSETMTRALNTGQILWFRLEAAPAKDITPNVRANLERWPEALRTSSQKTEVDWTQ